jgi:uncharacterized Rmd1/YagE family protein
MLSNLRNYINNIDKFTLRGIIYAGIAVIGLIVEIFILKKFRTMIMFGYGVVIFWGLIYILKLKEKKKN